MGFYLYARKEEKRVPKVYFWSNKQTIVSQVLMLFGN